MWVRRVDIYYESGSRRFSTLLIASGVWQRNSKIERTGRTSCSSPRRSILWLERIGSTAISSLSLPPSWTISIGLRKGQEKWPREMAKNLILILGTVAKNLRIAGLLGRVKLMRRIAIYLGSARWLSTEERCAIAVLYMNLQDASPASPASRPQFDEVESLF